MNLLDVSEPALIFNPEETVSKVASELFRQRKHEAVVMKNGEYKGILIARDLAKRKINQPDKVKIEQFIRKINPILPETPLNEVISSILINDYKAVPIEKEKKFFMLTKLSLLKLVKNNSAFRDKRAGEVMRFPYCVSSYNSITTAMSILREVGVSRLPVIDKDDKVEGIVDTIDLLKADIDRQRAKLGEEAGEKVKTRQVKISALMRKNVPKVTHDASIRKVIDLMINNNTPTVIVEDKAKVAGIITPKLILKLIGRAIEGVYVRISGIQQEDIFIKSVVDEEIRNEIRKLGKFIPIDYMILHVDRYHQTGERVKYSVKARLITEKGEFFADDHAWDLTQAVRGILQKLEREVIKKKGKLEVYRRGV